MNALGATIFFAAGAWIGYQVLLGRAQSFLQAVQGGQGSNQNSAGTPDMQNSTGGSYGPTGGLLSAPGGSLGYTVQTPAQTAGGTFA